MCTVMFTMPWDSSQRTRPMLAASSYVPVLRTWRTSHGRSTSRSSHCTVMSLTSRTAANRFHRRGPRWPWQIRFCACVDVHASVHGARIPTSMVQDAPASRLTESAPNGTTVHPSRWNLSWVRNRQPSFRPREAESGSSPPLRNVSRLVTIADAFIGPGCNGLPRHREARETRLTSSMASTSPGITSAVEG